MKQQLPIITRQASISIWRRNMQASSPLVLNEHLYHN